MSAKNSPGEDYTSSGPTLDAHLTSLTDVLHALRKAEKLDALTPEGMAKALQQVLANFKRDFPQAQAAPDSIPEPLVRDLVATYWEQVKARKNTASTGIKMLDDLLSGGIEAQRLVVMLGAPNTGKTTFTHQLAEHIACSGRPVLYVTSEDTPSALLAKTLSRLGKVPYTAVLKGWETERARIDAALAQQLDRLSMDRLRYLDATGGVTLDIIREKALAHFAQFPEEKGGGPGVLVVDYLQRVARAVKSMGGMSQDLREVVTLVAERLRAMACELDCAVIAIASQNRGGYSRGDQGAMATAKESGDIEYTCDVLMALAEDKDKNRKAVETPNGDGKKMGMIRLHIDKNRQGEKDRSIPLDFWSDCQTFTPAYVE